MAITFDNNSETIFAFPDGSAQVPYSVFATDIDGDGDIDVFSASSGGGTGTVAFHENLGDDGNDGDIDFNTGAPISEDDGATSVTSLDIDNDGTADGIVFAAQAVDRVAFSLFDNGSFETQQNFDSIASARAAITADLNGDGFDDIVAAAFGSASIVWFENNGDGTISTTPNTVVDLTAIEPNFNPNALFAADLDGDNDLDLAVSARNAQGDGALGIVLNDGSGNFPGNAASFATEPNIPTDVSGGDLDGDGDVDIVVASSESDELIVYQNNGDGTFADGQTLNTPNSESVYSVEVADLEGDGDLDIISASSVSGDVSVFENLGGGSFEAEQVIGTVDGVNSVFAADLDGDELLEIVASAYGDQEIVYFENTTVETVDITITIENLAPDNGTFLTPFWVGFHDGNFDLYDTGVALNPDFAFLESLAEDGDNSATSTAFNNSNDGFVDATIVGAQGTPDVIDPGEVVEFTINVDPTTGLNDFFSYASMVIPSNDFFVANGNRSENEIFDENGNFIPTEILILGNEVNDAGTEVNDEIPENTAFFGQTVPNTGVDENGVVTVVPADGGFLDPGSGGILDATDPINFTNADFTADGYQIARITLAVAEEPIEPADPVDLFANLDAAQEVDPSTSPATGTSQLTLNEAGDALTYSLTVTGLDFGGVIDGTPITDTTDDDVTRIHIHNAARGVNGGVVFGLIDTVAAELDGQDSDDLTITVNDDGSVTLTGIWEETDPASTPLSDFVDDIRDGNAGEDIDLYWNIHTNEFPAGAIRGQLQVAEAVTGETIEFSAANFTVAENAGNAELILTRTGDLSGESVVSIDVVDGTAQAGTDFGGTFPLEVTFEDGEAQETVLIPITDDDVDEGTENVTFAVTTTDDDITIGDQSSTVLDITEAEETIEFSAANFTVAEDGGNAQLVITRTGDLTGTSVVSVNIVDGTAEAGTDFGGTFPLEVTFNENINEFTLNLGINDDDIVEGTEDVTFTLTTADDTITIGNQASTVLEITDNDVAVPEIAFSSADFFVEEDGGTAQLTLTRTGDLSGESVVTVDVSGGTATADVDYTNNFPVSVTFAANEASQTVDVTILDDELEEGAENVTFALSGDATVSIGSQDSATLTISDNDQVITTPDGSLTFDDADNSFQIGGNVPVNLRATLSSVDAGLVSQIVAYNIQDGQSVTDILNTGQVVFSNLNQESSSEINFANPERILSGFNGGDNIGFALIPGSTREAVLAGVTPTSVVRLGNIQSSANGNVFTVNFEDSQDTTSQDFNDIVITLEATQDTPPIGTELQGNIELIDLTAFGGQLVTATIDSEGEAAFNNLGGLYVVEDINGTVLDPVTNQPLSPGDAGYAEAVLGQTNLVQFGTTDPDPINLAGGFLYAAYVIADGDSGSFYSTFSEANTDGSNFDHLILLGDNRFGFEDLPELGDADYDDFTFEVSLEVV